MMEFNFLSISIHDVHLDISKSSNAFIEVVIHNANQSVNISRRSSRVSSKNISEI